MKTYIYRELTEEDFEEALNTWVTKGYRLHSFNRHVVCESGRVNRCYAMFSVVLVRV